MSFVGRLCEFADARIYRSTLIPSERQVTGTLPPKFGQRPKVGCGRPADHQPTGLNGCYLMSYPPIKRFFF
jgi:hypothetical protein